MTDRSLLLRGSMLSALLRGQKTLHCRPLAKRAALDAAKIFGPSFLLKPGNADLLPCVVGDRYWIREEWANVAADPDCDLYKAGNKIAYRATDDDEFFFPPLWQAPSRMTRDLSRLTLRVDALTIKPLQEVSRGEAMELGCPHSNMAKGPDPRAWFVHEFNSYHASLASKPNPWVVVLAFTVHHCNIDHLADCQ